MSTETTARGPSENLRRARTSTDYVSIWGRFRRNLSVSVAGAIVAVGIKLCQTLLLTKALRIDDYGRVLIVINLFVLLNSFFGLRVSDVLFRFFPTLKEKDDTRALQGLLFLCFGLSVLTAGIIASGTFVIAPWLAERVYVNQELASLFKIYGWTLLLSSPSDVFGPILRMYDRFTFLIVSQILGSVVTLGLLALYLGTTDQYRLTNVILIFAVGVVIQNVLLAVHTARVVKQYLRDPSISLAARALRSHRRHLIRCLFNSNVSGYLKLALSPGDLFLLGIFSSPTQVAVYGIAKQLTGPLALLQANVQLAITPEITWLAAQRKIAQLKRLILKYVLSAFIGGGLLTIGSILLGHLLVVQFFKPEYIDALPIFYVLLIATWALLIISTFRPLAVSFDLLKYDNLTHLTTTLILVSTILVGWFNGLTMALIQLFAVAVLRLIFNLPILMRLRSAETLSAEGCRPALDGIA